MRRRIRAPSPATSEATSPTAGRRMRGRQRGRPCLLVRRRTRTGRPRRRRRRWIQRRKGRHRRRRKGRHRRCRRRCAGLCRRRCAGLCRRIIHRRRRKGRHRRSPPPHLVSSPSLSLPPPPPLSDPSIPWLLHRHVAPTCALGLIAALPLESSLRGPRPHQHAQTTADLTSISSARDRSQRGLRLNPNVRQIRPRLQASTSPPLNPN